jgi:hypothetical protein
MLSFMSPNTLPHGDCAPGAGDDEHRTGSTKHTDFGGLSSGAALVVVRLDVVPLQPSSYHRL